MIDRNGEPWFVAKDVCEVLGYNKEVSAVLAQLVDDEDRAPFNMNTLPNREAIRGNPRVSTVNESGLYSLILKSRKPEAKAFKRWITAEVLPTIRKTGGYKAPSVAKSWLDRSVCKLPHRLGRIDRA